MNLEEHDKRQDMQVWLSADEVTQLLDATEGTQETVAVGLGVRCGLRSHEILDVAPRDVHDTDAGTMLRVHHGKGDKYRETPIPSELATTIRTVGDIRGDEKTAVVDVTTTRSLRRMLNRVVDRIDSDDPGWNELTFHDLRRTWCTQIAWKDVDTRIVCAWGGWNSIDTFLEHYQGTSTPEAQLRERSKVEWL